MIAAACALLIAPVSADSAAALLGLSPPVEVRSAGGFLDGGSFGVNFIDVGGGTVTLRFERGFASNSFGRDQIGPSPWGHLFLRRGRGDERGVGRGAGLASAGAVLIRRWLEDGYPGEELAALRSMRRPPRMDASAADMPTHVAWEAVRVADSLAAYDAVKASPTEGEPAGTDEPTLGAVDFRQLPDIAAWLQVWSPGDTLTVSQFAFDSSRPLTSGPHWILADSGVVYAGFTPEEARNWVLSPDSSRAVRFLPDVDSEGYPITEPDTGVALCEFGPGRKRIILYCGTLCDFEAAAWLDATTVLIGGGDWEDFRPVLYRVDVLRGAVTLFVGPRRDGGRRTELEKDVQRLWEGRYPWIRWGDAPE